MNANTTNIHDSGRFTRRLAATRLLSISFLILWSAGYPPPGLAQEPGVTNALVRVGAVMDLTGDSRGLGLAMKDGIEAALKNQTVQGRRIEFAVRNDYYNPETATAMTQQLIQEGIFAMLGNVGTPTAKVVLPLLAEYKIPAVGFYTGASLLRSNKGAIVNYRASYAQEIASVIDATVEIGIKPTEICTFVQNDSFGMDGIAGLRSALAKESGQEAILAKLDQVIAMPGDHPARNGVGPVGVYQRNTLSVKEGYQSLKDWEKTSGHRCTLVVTVGTYLPIANFIAYARYKKESWLFSAVSFTGDTDLKAELKKQNISDGVVMTQVVPALNSGLPIVEDARRALGVNLSYVLLEGYIVGRLFLAIAGKIEGPLTRENFLKAAYGRTFDLGGLKIDFTKSNQGSDLVQLTYLNKGSFEAVVPQDLVGILRP